MKRAIGRVPTRAPCRKLMVVVKVGKSRFRRDGRVCCQMAVRNSNGRLTKRGNVLMLGKEGSKTSSAKGGRSRRQRVEVSSISGSKEVAVISNVDLGAIFP